ncbi:MAG: hypothetical protein KDD44_02770, partial [Bdellovibrionales bacterium]|nr:hypothetical protein [Bdellovibrionales bacterium]
MSAIHIFFWDGWGPAIPVAGDGLDHYTPLQLPGDCVKLDNLASECTKIGSLPGESDSIGSLPGSSTPVRFLPG